MSAGGSELVPLVGMSSSSPEMSTTSTRQPYHLRSHLRESEPYFRSQATTISPIRFLPLSFMSAGPPVFTQPFASTSSSRSTERSPLLPQTTDYMAPPTETQSSADPANRPSTPAAGGQTDVGQQQKRTSLKDWWVSSGLAALELENTGSVGQSSPSSATRWSPSGEDTIML